MSTFNEKYDDSDPYDIAIDGVREFFELLDQVEFSDSENEFHPVSIRCCRTHLIPKLEEALSKMRVVVK